MRVDPRSCTLLKGVAGSTAYGLNHALSDKDYIGMFAVPTVKLFELEAPNLDVAIEYKDPDQKYYEAGKYCKLALACNPSILELMWLNEYNVRTSYGDKLVSIRDAFLSRSAVRNAYMGYASQQYGRLDRNKDLNKRAKNARHFRRLLFQGSQLYKTGNLIVKLPEPELFVKFGEEVAKGNDYLAEKALADAQKIFNGPSALAKEPNKSLVNEWLVDVRHGLYKDPNRHAN